MTEQNPQAAAKERFELLVGAVIIVVAALIAYGESFSCAWHFDDFTSVLRKGAFEQDFATLGRVVRRQRAVVDLTFFANHAANGESVTGYHAVNLAIHVGASLFLLGFVRRTPGGAPLALPAALLFVVHPLQTESVTYIAQRAQSLMGLFELASFYCFARGQSSARRGAWHAGTVATFFLGMLTKPHLVLEPVLLLLYDRAFFAPSVGEALRRSRVLYGALFATWVAGAAWVVRALAKANWSDIGEGGRTPLSYAAAQAWAIPYSLWLSVSPRTLSIDYGWRSVSAGRSVAGAVVVLGLVAATVQAWRRSPPLGFLGAWFFLNLLPVSSVIPRVDLMVEHRMYVPLAAVIVAAVLGARRLLATTIADAALAKNVGLGVLGVAALLLTLRTRARNEDYLTERSLWTATVATSPDNPRAHHNLATALRKDGDLDGAAREFTRAVELDPGFGAAWNDRGDLARRAGRLADALADYTRATEDRRSAANAFYNRAFVLQTLGRKPEAVEDFTRAIALKPRMAPALYERGCARAELGQHEGAIADFTATIGVSPGLAPAYQNRALSLLRLGRPAEALADLERATALVVGSRSER